MIAFPNLLCQTRRYGVQSPPMIVFCGTCSAQNFVSPERLAVRDIPPRCWECGRELPVPPGGPDPPGETRRKDPESYKDAE